MSKISTLDLSVLIAVLGKQACTKHNYSIRQKIFWEKKEMLWEFSRRRDGLWPGAGDSGEVIVRGLHWE